MIHISNRILCSCMEWWNYAICWNLVENGKYLVEWNNSEEKDKHRTSQLICGIYNTWMKAYNGVKSGMTRYPLTSEGMEKDREENIPRWKEGKWRGNRNLGFLYIGDVGECYDYSLRTDSKTPQTWYLSCNYTCQCVKYTCQSGSQGVREKGEDCGNWCWHWRRD